MIYPRTVEVTSQPAVALKNVASVGYKIGQKVTLDGTPQPGFRFVRWEAGGKEISKESQYAFVLKGDSPLQYKAVFEEAYTFSGGEGTILNPYKIGSLEQLAQLSYVKSLWDKHFVLTADIDAAPAKSWHWGKGFLPIGSGDVFRGSLNGNGHLIKNLYINRPKERDVGLFGHVRTGSGKYIPYSEFISVQKLGIINASITGYNSVGTISGSFYAKGRDLFAQGTVKTEGPASYGDYIGGIVGNTYYNQHVKLVNVFSLVKIIERDKTRVFSYIGNGMVNSYWDKEVTGANTAKGVSNEYGLLTREFADVSNFKGWDFDKVWEIQILPEVDKYPRPYFKQQKYDAMISVNLVPTSSHKVKSISGEKGYNVGEQVKLSVIPKAGYQLSAWVAGKDTVSTEKEYSFVLKKDSPEIYTVRFEENPQFAGGDGSLMDPYQIATLSQLEQLSWCPSLWDKHFILIADIDASATKTWDSGKGFYPIVRDFYDPNRQPKNFEGSFNGNGKTMSGLVINRPHGKYIGLFGRLVSESRKREIFVKNLLMKEVNISGNAYVGAVAGECKGNISNVCVRGSVKGETEVGGVVGYCRGSAQRVISSGEVSGVSNVGGLFGVLRANVRDCYSVNYVKGKMSVGGLAGDASEHEHWNKHVTIANSYSFGKIESEKGVGGIVGQKENKLILKNSFWNKTSNLGLAVSEEEKAYGRTAGQFGEQKQFKEWDFKSIWEMKKGKEEGAVVRPHLRWENAFIVDASVDLELGTVEGSGWFQQGASCTLSAKPASNRYTLKRWVLNGKTYSEEPTITFKVEQNMSFFAEFALKEYKLQINTTAGGKVMQRVAGEKENEYMLVKPATSFKHGQSQNIAIVLIPDEGYEIHCTINGQPAYFEKYKENWIKTLPGIDGDVTIDIQFYRLLSAEKLLAPAVYPNPVRDQLQLRNLVVGGIIELRSLSGVVVKQATAKSEVHTLDCSALPAGVYLLRIDGKMIQKIFKQ
ncbi:MAG: T9SS type A sorting domain-containing protein [Cytophagales bacterium]|nr:T9SS type A sorting domain-containing protein [Cytophagales bacterium]